MKRFNRSCTVFAVLSLAGCASTQQVLIDQPAGYRATAYGIYHNETSSRCRSSFSIGTGHWIYMYQKSRRFESPSTGPAKFDIPDRVHRGLCTQYLQRLEIETTPDHGGEAIQLAQVDLGSATKASPAHEVRLNCSHEVSLGKANSLKQEIRCWPHEKTDIGWQVKHISSSVRLAPLHVHLELPAEPGYLGPWVRIGDQHIPYQLVYEQPGMARVQLLQIHRDGRSCNSHPTCEHGIEPSKVMALAVLHAKVTNTYWAHSGPDTPAIFESANASDWVSDISNKLYRWKWQRQDQMDLLVRTYLYARDTIDEPAWNPLPGEASETHFARCKKLFGPASHDRYQLNQIKSEVGRWIAHQPSALREDIFKKEGHPSWIAEQVRDLQRWNWASPDQISFLLAHRAISVRSRSLACEPLIDEEPDQHFLRCQRLFGPTPKQ